MCKPANQKTRPEGTGGICSGVGGDAKSSMIIEPREILAAEANLVKEAILVTLKRKYLSLDLRIHDIVCACQFAACITRRLLLDLFHIGNRKKDICRAKSNPGAPSSCQLRYSFGRTNTFTRD